MLGTVRLFTWKHGVTRSPYLGLIAGRGASGCRNIVEVVLVHLGLRTRATHHVTALNLTTIAIE